MRIVLIGALAMAWGGNLAPYPGQSRPQNLGLPPRQAQNLGLPPRFEGGASSIGRFNGITTCRAWHSSGMLSLACRKAPRSSALRISFPGIEGANRTSAAGGGGDRHGQLVAQRQSAQRLCGADVGDV